MEKAPPKSPSPLSRLFHNIFDYLGLNRGPDSTEELEHEIQELIDDGEEQGLISSREGEMINSILEFRDTEAREIMTPSSEMVRVEAETPFHELLQLIIDKGYSRIPVFAGSQDNIIGILYAKDLLKHVNDQQLPKAGDLVKPAYFALENQKIIFLLRDFQAKKVHLAIITDEFGSVRGLASLEDVLEEIVGEITDESDQPASGWQVLDQNTILADAKTDLEEIEKHFDLKLPEGPYESIGGMMIHQLGYLPGANTTVRVGGLDFQVLSATKRRIIQVKISRSQDQG
ncbi:MAG: hemolysin family protein [Desulfobulbaceae bacterium]|nr:hemolysin family protein [Desulfobulbaceae bacterium]